MTKRKKSLMSLQYAIDRWKEVWKNIDEDEHGTRTAVIVGDKVLLVVVQDGPVIDTEICKGKDLVAYIRAVDLFNDAGFDGWAWTFNMGCSETKPPTFQATIDAIRAAQGIMVEYGDKWNEDDYVLDVILKEPVDNPTDPILYETCEEAPSAWQGDL
jgi:hypothetical protein